MEIKKKIVSIIVKKIGEKRVEKNRGTTAGKPKKKWMKVIREGIRACREDEDNVSIIERGREKDTSSLISYARDKDEDRKNH